MINKVEEIRISCECVGGLVLGTIPNTSGNSDGTHILGLGSSRQEQEQRKDDCDLIKEFSEILLR